jgi:hypothetical protein
MLLTPDLAKVGPEGYIHGWVCVRPPCGGVGPGRVRAADLGVTKDGTVVHRPSGYAIGSVKRADDGHGFTASHAMSGDEVTRASRADAVAALSRKHNKIVKPESADRTDSDVHTDVMPSPHAMNADERGKYATIGHLTALNELSHTYTDEQIKALSDHIDELQEEADKEAKKDSRFDIAVDTGIIVAAIGLSFLTAGASLFALVPLLTNVIPALGGIFTKSVVHIHNHGAPKIVAATVAAAREKLGKVPNLKPALAAKADSSISSAVIAQVAHEIAKQLAAGGLDPDVAYRMALAMTSQAALALKAGKFPGDNDFITADGSPAEKAADSVMVRKVSWGDLHDAVWANEQRDARGRWTSADGGLVAGSTISDMMTASSYHQETHDNGVSSQASITHMEIRHSVMKAVAAANNQHQMYTEDEVKALADRINALEAEVHTDHGSETKFNFALSLGASVTAIALSFFTAGASLLALIPILAEKGPDIANVIAGFIHDRASHTENPFTPLKPGEKSESSSAEQVSAAFASILEKNGLPTAVAQRVAIAITNAAQAQLDAGKKPWDADFTPAGLAGQVSSLVTVEKSAETAALSSVHHPLGTHGLWGDKSAQLPSYIQNIAHAMIRSGHDESSAIALAIGAVKRWAAGRGKVTPEVRAAAGKALAEWEKLKAEHSKSKSLDPELVKVGPKGYEHGWVFVGIPSPGDKVSLGGKAGTVGAVTSTHARVKLSDGTTASIPHDGGPGKAKLVARAEEHAYQGRFASTKDSFIPDMAPAPDVKTLTSPGRVGGDGTPADPIDVQGDINRAILLMAQGKSVRLNQPDEISVLASKVNDYANKIKAKTGAWPKWDFSNITVKGTNLFTAQTKGIPRIKMPQLSGDAQPGTRAAEIAGGAGKFTDVGEEFRKQLAADGVKVTDRVVKVTHLRATQNQLTASTVSGIAEEAMRGDAKVLAMLKEPLWVTQDGYVLDGHHRWAAKMVMDAQDGILGNDTTQEVHQIGMDIGAVLPYANTFAKKIGIAPEDIGNAYLVKPTSKAAAAPDIIKVGPEGYIHGFICVLALLRKQITQSATLEHVGGGQS